MYQGPLKKSDERPDLGGVVFEALNEMRVTCCGELGVFTVEDFRR
jgi:hypothetical protein